MNKISISIIFENKRKDNPKLRVMSSRAVNVPPHIVMLKKKRILLFGENLFGPAPKVCSVTGRLTCEVGVR